MPKYAAGKYAYGISDRSGFRYRLRDMRKEWNGFLVGKDEYEEKHPQLEPKHHKTDAEALRDPRPDTNNIIPITADIPSFNLETLEFIQVPLLSGKIGVVSFSGAVVTPIELTGVSSASALGSVTISASTSASTFDSTSVTLDSTNKTFDEG
tara:strand:- start:21 stop:476 length:456 start_codon:yes stop_codon:yes gene_type:complete